MTVLIHGAAGAMGLELQALAEKAGWDTILVDAKGGEGIYKDFSQVRKDCDLLIDFSFHTATEAAIGFAVTHGIPAVIGTTGHTEQERELIYKASEQIPVFYTGNMSLGIAVLCKLVRDAARYFPEADIEILEIHHNRKADAPSGTALMLAKAAGDTRQGAELHCGRAGVGKRKPQEIGVSSLRLGNTVGIHEVMISTGTQTLTLKHEAHDRALFAQGAMEAARFMLEQKPGLYTMDNLVK